MDLRKLKTLIDLVSESEISELEITEAEGKVRIVKGGQAVYMQAPAAMQMAAPAAAPAGAARTGRQWFQPGVPRHGLGAACASS